MLDRNTHSAYIQIMVRMYLISNKEKKMIKNALIVVLTLTLALSLYAGNKKKAVGVLDKSDTCTTIIVDGVEYTQSDCF